MRVRVAINGFGTIGKRIADAVSLQDDMELIGVSKTRPNYEALAAVRRGYPLYVPADRLEVFEEAGIRVAGTLDEMLSKADVVVDATPGGVGAKYKPVYEEHGVKMVFQGGEKAHVAEASFNTLCNYEETLGKQSLRVVSCNTTGLLRIICSIHKAFGVKAVRAVIVRRGADPKENKRGPINSIVLNPPRLPSHHGEDVKTVLPWLDIMTAAVAVPTTLMHVHFLNVKLEKRVSREDVLGVLENSPRIVIASASGTGIQSTAELVEYARDLGRARYDLPELVVWEDSITVAGNELLLFQAVHQESIVVPENIDAIRAVAKLETDPAKTIEKTDKALGLRRGWLS